MEGAGEVHRTTIAEEAWEAAARVCWTDVAEHKPQAVEVAYKMMAIGRPPWAKAVEKARVVAEVAWAAAAKA